MNNSRKTTLAWIRPWLCLALALVLSACAVNPKVLGVPQVLIQELQQQNGTVRARVLLHNFSNVEMNFSELDYQLNFAGAPAAAAKATMSLLVPPGSPESLEIELSLSSQAQQTLKTGGRFDYEISGTITSSKPSRQFRFNYQGKLGPTPGKVGSWR